MMLLGKFLIPTIPLIKTVIGGAVKEKTWQIVRIIKFLLSTLFFNSYFVIVNDKQFQIFLNANNYKAKVLKNLLLT